MSSRPRALLLACPLLLLSTWDVSAQQSAGSAPKLPRVITAPPGVATLGIPGMPALPALGSNPRRDSLRDADRLPVTPSDSQQAAFSVPGTAPINAILDKAFTGTGFDEYYSYQVPPGYDPNGLPAPLLIAYHGFGSPASSVATQTLLDELCALRGWFYLSVTGVDDKLFGTDVAQRNVDAVIRHMLDTYTIDPDRLYMVGFSMGAGVTANYAATHRDPDDIMIAAVGLVSGAYDWPMTWTLDPGAQPWMLNPYNFGDSPSNAPFAYQRASALFNDTASYPPIPGVLDTQRSFAWNLEDIPAWISWDVGDSITYLPGQTQQLIDLLTARGGEVFSVQVSGTLNPKTGQPATHSWAVMEPFSLIHFLDGRKLERWPEDLDVMLDEDAAISFVEVTQAAPGDFTRLTAAVDVDAKAIGLDEGENLGGIAFNMDASGLADTWPVRVTVTAAEEHDLELIIQDDADLPGYLMDLATGELLSGTEWDALARTLSVTVPALTTGNYLAEGAPWGTSLSMTPDPAAPGQDVSLKVHSPSGPGTLWMILSLQEGLLPVGPGVLLAVSPMPPAILVPLALDSNGDLELTVTMPSDPGLGGLRLSFQGAVVTAGGWIVDTSNPFALDIL